MMINPFFLFTVGALVTTVTAAPTRAVTRGAYKFPDDACNPKFTIFGKSERDGVPWEEQSKGDYFCTTRFEWGAVITGGSVWTDKSMLIFCIPNTRIWPRSQDIFEDSWV